MNNGEYRTLKDTLDERKSRSTALGSYVGLDLRPPALAWSDAARFFGVRAVRAGSAAELRDTVAMATTLDEPLLIDVPVAGHCTAPSRGESS